MTRKNKNRNKGKGSRIAGNARGNQSNARETKGDGIVQHSDSQVKQQGTKQASEECPLVQPTHDSGKSNKGCDYVTMEELTAMDQYTNVVVDMSPILKKKCDIYTQAFVVFEGIDSHRAAIATHSTKYGNEVYRKTVAHCTSVDPEALFHAMNTGGKEELKEWKLFSAQCLLIATHRYLTHKKPFPVRLEGDPPLLLTTRNRARITQFWSSYIFGKGDNDEPSGFKGGFVVGAGCEHMHFSLSEIGSDDPVTLDVSEYVNGFKLAIQKPRDGLLGMIHDIFKTCEKGLIKFHKDMYKQLRKEVAGFTEDFMRTQSRAAADSCTCLAVYDRLLNGKPLRIVDSERSRYMTSMDEPNEDDDYDPTTSSGKGGYEVHGEFVKGAGVTTVHLSFDDVDPDMYLWVNMGQELGDSTAIGTTHGQIMHLYKQSMEKVKELEPEVVKRLAIELRRMCVDVNPNTYEHAQAGSKEAAEKWEEHMLVCLTLVTTLSAAYKKPICLCYDEASWETHPNSPDYEACGISMRGLCLSHCAKE